MSNYVRLELFRVGQEGLRVCQEPFHIITVVAVLNALRILGLQLSPARCYVILNDIRILELIQTLVNRITIPQFLTAVAFKRPGPFFIKKNLVFDQGLLVNFLVFLYLLLNFVEQVGINHSFIPCSIRLLLQQVYLRYLFVRFMQYLFNVVLNLFDFLFNPTRNKLFRSLLNSLNRTHLTL